MALVAIAAELAAVDIRVTVRAGRGSVGKEELDVTLPAIHRCMKTPERVPGLIVTELRRRTDRTQAGRRMAICAGNPQRAVRTLGAASYCLGMNRPGREQQAREHQQKQTLNEAMI
jgi:hypothetical protein